ncbi:MAG: lysophospholipid acyltransferase family protein [Phycisphaerae bacterium]
MKVASFPNPLLRGWRFTEGVPRPNLVYRSWRRLFQVTMTAFWRVRVFNRHYEPQSGGAAYICNHQSFLDPMLMSFALRRPMNYMARDTLFRVPGFKQLIQMLNAFPVKRNTADTTAIKEAMRRLKAGGQVVVFAEGTRTRTGHIGQFLPGVALLAQRAAQWTVPVLIDGAFEAWPRSQMLPHAGSIVVQYARPIAQDKARQMRPDEFLAAVRSTIIEMQADVRRRVGRPPLAYN